MHARYAISVVMFVMFVATGLGTSVGAQEIASSDDAGRPRFVHFTDTEMERFQAIAAEMAARRESYIRASEDDEIIALEPYIVEGDSSLLRARIRRALDQGVGAQRQIFLGLAPSIQQELLFARRSQDAFFRPGSVGRPSDAPNFDGIDLLRMPQKLLRLENLGGLFSAPVSVVGE